MRELILLRHAESEQSCADGTDSGRDLTEHGRAEARDAGHWLAGHKLNIDRVLCSPAKRTRETAALALPNATPVFADEIYEATPGDLIALLDDHGDADTVVLVGHNPSIEQLVAFLVEGRSEDYRGMPPGALALLRLHAPLEPGAATLEAFWSP
jgi:phosphohistidine phosphatase SixA